MMRSNWIVALATCGLVAGIAACAEGGIGGPPDDVDPQAVTANCTLGQGYWSNHAADWPVTQLTLGLNVYSQAQLLQILATPPAGNGLVQLARQLIAAKLNIANGADPTAIVLTVVAADALIGTSVVPPIGSGTASPSSTSALIDALADYNEGTIGPGQCADDPNAESRCGDGVIDPGEGCDDGNTVDGDGCSSVCALPGCGNGTVDPGEQCDDGNAVNGDGCSVTCRLPACGDGTVDANEQCDDGNASNGDGCSSTCQLSRCGDGWLDQGEQCDDGNDVVGDGCTPACVFESIVLDDAGAPPADASLDDAAP